MSHATTKHHAALRATLFVALLAAPPLTTSASSLPGRQRMQDSAAKPSGGPGTPTEGDAARAEELYQRGAELSKKGDKQGALDALGEAVKLYGRIYLGSHVLTTQPSAGSAPTTQFRAEMAERLRHAPECIELFKSLGGDKGKKEFERGQLEALRAHAQGLVETDPSRAVYFSRETDTRADIEYKPEPRFPRGARGSIVSVVVRVRAVLGADGVVRDVLVLSGPPEMFGESSVEAAKGVKFKPAEKGGRRVSQFVTLEYGFRSF